MNWFVYLLMILNFQQDPGPENFIWRNRILIYTGEKDFSEWLSSDLCQGLEERKLLYFNIQKDSLVHSNYKSNIKIESFRVKLDLNMISEEKWVLIGLDGVVKNCGKSLPHPTEIFKIIDAMPMRQSELFKKENQDNSLNK